MLDFYNFILEQAEDQPNTQKHLPNATEHALSGHEGVGKTDAVLRGLHNYLLGKSKNVPNRVETKIDGAPAFHIGKDKEGRVFVATKSLYNKDPKINYTEEDVDRNHGHAPGLAAALKEVLKHAHKVLPADMKPGEMYKGDLMFSKGEKGLKKDGEFVSAQPNLLKYMWPKGTAEAEKASNSKIGFALHTMFDKNGNAQPISNKQREKFVDHPDVFNYDPRMEANPQNYSPEDQRAFETHMENARKTYSGIKPDVYDRLAGHDQHMLQFINNRVRNGQEGSGTVDEYMDFLNAKANKDIDSVKTAQAKERKTQKHAALMQQVAANSKDAQKILDLHGHFQAAKHALIDVMDKNSKETIQYPDGSPGHHEGAVITMPNGEQHKVTDQRPTGFASRNLSGQGAIAGAAKKKLTEYFRSKKNLVEAVEEPEGDHAMIIGGFSPPTKGHESVFNQASQAGHNSVNIYTTESSRRPIPASDKVGYIKKVAPQANVNTTKNAFEAMSHLYSSGKRGNVTIYGGSDRAGMADQLKKYNGVKGPHGFFQFNKIDFKQVGGERSDDAAGLSGVSGSKARKSKSPEELKNYLPKALHKDAGKIFNQINEETTTAAVGGLGFNTGNPAVNNQGLSDYINNAVADADTRNNILKGMIEKSYVNKHHKLVGFKAYLSGERSQKGK